MPVFSRGLTTVLGAGILALCGATQAEIRLAGCGPMRISWDFMPASGVELQFWSLHSDRWMTLVNAVEAKGAVEDVEMDDGSMWLPKATFYRARLCDDSTCTNSKVAWIPAYVCPEERYEDYVAELMEPLEIRHLDGSVKTVTVSPQFTQRLKIIQYNTYASFRVQSRWERPWPPMQRPGYVDDEKATIGDWVRFNVWLSHEASQTGEPPDVAGTGFEEYVDVGGIE